MDVYRVGDSTPSPTLAAEDSAPSTLVGCFKDEFGVEGEGRVFSYAAPESSVMTSSVSCFVRWTGLMNALLLPSVILIILVVRSCPPTIVCT